MGMERTDKILKGSQACKDVARLVTLGEVISTTAGNLSHHAGYFKAWYDDAMTQEEKEKIEELHRLAKDVSIMLESTVSQRATVKFLEQVIKDDNS